MQQFTPHQRCHGSADTRDAKRYTNVVRRFDIKGKTLDFRRDHSRIEQQLSNRPSIFRVTAE